MRRFQDLEERSELFIGLWLITVANGSSSKNHRGLENHRIAVSRFAGIKLALEVDRIKMCLNPIPISTMPCVFYVD